MADSVTAEMQDILRDLIELYEDASDEEKVEIARELRQNWREILDRTGHGPTEKREVDADVEHSGSLDLEGATVTYAQEDQSDE